MARAGIRHWGLLQHCSAAAAAAAAADDDPAVIAATAAAAAAEDRSSLLISFQGEGSRFPLVEGTIVSTRCVCTVVLSFSLAKL
jgi:hypothetical protein